RRAAGSWHAREVEVHLPRRELLDDARCDVELLLHGRGGRLVLLLDGTQRRPRRRRSALCVLADAVYGCRAVFHYVDPPRSFHGPRVHRYYRRTVNGI